MKIFTDKEYEAQKSLWISIGRSHVVIEQADEAMKHNAEAMKRAEEDRGNWPPIDWYGYP